MSLTTVCLISCFLEKIANFPSSTPTSTFEVPQAPYAAYCIIRKAGLDILSTGVITEKVIDSSDGRNWSVPRRLGGGKR